VLELANVDAYYGNSRALQNVSLTVAKGQFLTVLGRNGVGKTTLMRTILGLMSRATGRISLDGQDVSRLRTDQRARAGIGYVPQGRGILPRFTVRENLRIGRFANAAKTMVDDAVMELFPALRAYYDKLGGNLSGGQQQQLAIARALLTDPRVILLDEPTEGIQPNIVEEIENVIGYLNRERHMTIVVVEQSVGFARRASDRFLIMEKGSVAIEGPVAELTDSIVQKHMSV
jgi:urea transport system ATP-binding protein